MKNAPCKDIATEFVHGKLTDHDTVVAFAQDCEVITIEIENVSISALKELVKQESKSFLNRRSLN